MKTFIKYLFLFCYSKLSISAKGIWQPIENYFASKTFSVMLTITALFSTLKCRKNAICHNNDSIQRVEGRIVFLGFMFILNYNKPKYPYNTANL